MLQWCLILDFQEMHLCCCSKHAQLVCLKTLLLFAPSFTQLKIFLQLMKCQLIMEQSWDLFIILFAKVTRQSSVIQSKGLWFYIEHFDPLENHKRNLHPWRIKTRRRYTCIQAPSLTTRENLGIWSSTIKKSGINCNEIYKYCHTKITIFNCFLYTCYVYA